MVITNKSGSITESFVRLHCDTPYMSEVIIWHFHGMQVVKTRVHVDAGLDVVLRHSLLLEVYSRLTMRGVRNGLVFLGKPAPLSGCLLLHIPLQLDILADACCYGLDSLLKGGLPIIASKLLVFVELRLGSASGSSVLSGWILATVL